MNNTKYTGVERRVLGTTKKSHSSGSDLIIPHQFVGCKRGELGTNSAKISKGETIVDIGIIKNVERGINSQAESHQKGTKFHVFKSIDDMIREVVAHEIMHVTGHIGHKSGTIMSAKRGRGAYQGGSSTPLHDSFSQDVLKEFNAK